MNSPKTSSNDTDCLTKVLPWFSYALVFLTFPFSMLFCLKVAQEYERAVVFRIGRLLRDHERGPGIFFILPCIDTYKVVDLRTVSFTVPTQEVLTSDSLTVSAEAVVNYRIIDAAAAVTKVTNVGQSIRLLSATTLRNYIGGKTLSEVVSAGQQISSDTQTTLNETTLHWGVYVERLEVKEVRLPFEMQKPMSREALMTREARAQIIASEGERSASPALREAGDVLSGHGMTLRGVTGLQQMASKSNTNVFIV